MFANATMLVMVRSTQLECVWQGRTKGGGRTGRCPRASKVGWIQRVKLQKLHF